MSTPGWGGLEQRVQERQRETIQGVDANTTLQLGKFLPDFLGVQLPLYLGYSETVSTPQFDPLSPDVEQGAQLIRAGANKLGWSVKPFKRNIRECALTGHCLSGCKTERKQSMLVSYLPWATAHGARIFADTRVTEVLADGGQARGAAGLSAARRRASHRLQGPHPRRG